MQRFLAAGVGAGVAEITTLPVDAAKVRLQLQAAGSGSAKYTGLLQGMWRIGADEGARALWRGLEPALVRRSVCAARRAFGGVVVGVCDGADLRALDLLDDAEDGVFDATALPDGVFVVPLPCAAAPRAQTSARHVDHAAAAPLVKWAHAQVKGDAAAWRGLFFAAVGDVVAVRDVDALAAAAAPTTFVVPHRLRDGAARHNKRPPCDARERDWVTPLADPGRGDARRDLTAYHVVPR